MRREIWMHGDGGRGRWDHRNRKERKGRKEDEEDWMRKGMGRAEKGGGKEE